MNAIVLIPARLGSTRLPNKPLADIGGLPMIEQVRQRALETGIGRVVVAAAEQQIVDEVQKAGGEAVLTRPDHPRGSDRIYEALTKLDPDRQFDLVINIQGDLPTLDPDIVKKAVQLMNNPAVDVATLVAEITREDEKTNPNVVKAVLEPYGDGRQGRALYFTRATAPYGDGPLYHHIGLYVYRRAALEQYVAAKPSVLEERESLEQLRALALGMRIDAAIVETVPIGVDTAEDLERARRFLAGLT